MKLLCRLIRNESFCSIILIIAALFAMLLSNLGTAQQRLYHDFINTPIEIRIGALEIKESMLLWINDALMSIFFLLVGLDIKHELIRGSLNSRQYFFLPAIAALGGMVVPMLIYLVFNYHNPITRVGWAIPAATDIAFTLGILSLMGKRTPIVLKKFLTVLAIIDDLGAIIIIALFYTKSLSFLPLIIALGLILILALLNIYNVHHIGIYIMVGIMLWIAILKSGVHATLTGVIVGLFIPLKEREGISSPARNLENILYPWVTFIILPLFAFSNAGVSVHDMNFNELILTLPLGIIFGLFFGKPLGISLFCWLSLKFKVASLPRGTTLSQIIATGFLCGVGFTMSIFIANLAFENLSSQFIAWAKLGILIGSLLASLVGYILLRSKLSEITR